MGSGDVLPTLGAALECNAALEALYLRSCNIKEKEAVEVQKKQEKIDAPLFSISNKNNFFTIFHFNCTTPLTVKLLNSPSPDIALKHLYLEGNGLGSKEKAIAATRRFSSLKV